MTDYRVGDPCAECEGSGEMDEWCFCSCDEAVGHIRGKQPCFWCNGTGKQVALSELLPYIRAHFERRVPA